MKSAQWMAVIVLTCMVGGISFVSVYLGSTGGNDTAKLEQTLPTLSFPLKTVPREGEAPLITEVGQLGHQDYWFVNESGQDVSVGLIEKGCTCSEATIELASPRWFGASFAASATEALQLPLRDWTALATLAAVYENPLAHVETESDETQALVLNKENSFVVPMGAVGRVRLSWRQKDVKPLITFANLWQGQRGGSSARLEAGVRIVAPVEANKELILAPINDRNLEKSQQGFRAWIECWSETRSSFAIKGEVVRENGSAESDPVQVGDPVPLSAEEIAERNGKDGQRLPFVRSGYKIPVTIHAKAKDGTPIEWGRFTRIVQLSSSDPTIEPKPVTVTGVVQGNVTVGSGKTAGGINLGFFYRKNGAHGETVLQTDDRAIDLQLDTSHVADYLKPTLSKARETSPGHRLWQLSVEVPAGEAQGDFPRADNPVYRDSAIYVKTVDVKTGKPLRSIRIPVRGVAND